MQWFKFYGAEYLLDQKMSSLTTSEKCCWITLLCFAGMSESGGVITHLSEEHLMRQTGIIDLSDEWNRTAGILAKFVKLGMITHDNDVITLSNWTKRQGTALSGYERLKRHREKKYNDNAMITNDNGKRERIERKKERTEDVSKETGKGMQTARELLEKRGILRPSKKT